MDDALQRDLRALAGDAAVLDPGTPAYLADATESRAIRGRADAVVLPADAAQVAAVVAFCHRRGLAVVPRGGGTGYAGGAVPVDGGVVVGLERLDAIHALEPAHWRAHVGAGVITATLQRRARESGVFYPPDPGAAEASQLGGNLATNAAGPHSFKYGVTRAWVTGVEAVLAPGERVRFGGPVRKDVGGYDLAGLLVGSEGTLGIITAAWLRLVPAPEAQLPVLAAFPDLETGCAAIASVFATGLQPATLEYLDGATLRAAADAGLPPGVAPDAGLMVIAEADGCAAEAERVRAELQRAVRGGRGDRSPRSHRASTRSASCGAGGEPCRARSSAQRGGKFSEDIVVPVEHLGAAIARTQEIGDRHGLPACSWGHAGDGNLHSSFLIDPATGARPRARGRPRRRNCSPSPRSSAARSRASTASA